MSKFVAALAAVMALALCGAAQAATIYNYDLTEADPAAGFGNVATFGTVQVTDNGIDLFVAVALADGYELRHANDTNHHALTFKLDTTGETASNLTGFLANNTQINYFHQASGTAFTQQPFGSAWNYAINCPAATSTTAGCTTGWSPTKNPTKMDFKLAGLSIHDLASVPYTGAHGAKNLFFAVDVVNIHGYTGNVGATWDGHPQYGVPEPATWGLMILGFGAIGGALRRRRSQLAAA